MIKPGDKIGLFVTHADGSTSGHDINIEAPKASPRTLDEASEQSRVYASLGLEIMDAILDDPGENGGRWTPPVSIEVVNLNRILASWELTADKKLYQRRAFNGQSVFFVNVKEVECAVVDALKLTDDHLTKLGYKLIHGPTTQETT